MAIARRLVLIVAAAFAPGMAGAALPSSIVCGDLKPPGQFGPFDYRTIPSEPKYLVEMAHFTPKVENLLSGNAGSIGSDLDYTLRASAVFSRSVCGALNFHQIAARGFAVSDATVARIRGCADHGTLDRWVARAATVASLGDRFG